MIQLLLYLPRGACEDGNAIIRPRSFCGPGMGPALAHLLTLGSWLSLLCSSSHKLFGGQKDPPAASSLLTQPFSGFVLIHHGPLGSSGPGPFCCVTDGI